MLVDPKVVEDTIVHGKEVMTCTYLCFRRRQVVQRLFPVVVVAAAPQVTAVCENLVNSQIFCEAAS